MNHLGVANVRDPSPVMGAVKVRPLLAVSIVAGPGRLLPTLTMSGRESVVGFRKVREAVPERVMGDVEVGSGRAAPVLACLPGW